MIVVLSGGVGGARFLEGLVQVVPSEDICVIGNTGDDEEFYGLHVSPDLDIVLYTLSGIVNETQGWGFKDETYNTMQQLTKLGNDDWFQLGDKDLATHIYRTQLLKKGKTLTEVTNELRKKFGVGLKLLPMSDQLVQTYIKTPQGSIPFQEYFVKNRAKDQVLDIIYTGAQKVKAAPGVIDALMSAHAVVVAPSNPLVSIGTILSVSGIKEALCKTKAPIVAVSPLIQGKTIKGPADKMMQGMDMEISAVGICEYYKEFLDIMVIDTLDEALKERIEKLGIKTVITDTIMRDKMSKKNLARTILTELELKQ